MSLDYFVKMDVIGRNARFDAKWMSNSASEQQLTSSYYPDYAETDFSPLAYPYTLYCQHLDVT